MQPWGPIGLIGQDLFEIGGALREDMTIVTPSEADLNLLEEPMQHMRPRLSALRARARTLAACDMRQAADGLRELDVQANAIRRQDFPNNEDYEMASLCNRCNMG